MTDLATLAQATIETLRAAQQQAERDRDLSRIREAAVAIRDVKEIVAEQGIYFEEAA